jgi:hypothetical protein
MSQSITYRPRKDRVGTPSDFICYWCDKPSSIDFFRSKYSHVCMECYQVDIARKARKTNAKYGRLKYTAAQRGLTLTISQDEYEALTKHASCHYCGGPIEETGSGIDRKDNALGYSIDNVVPSCRWCNVVKNDRYSYEEMVRLGSVVGEIHRARGAWENGAPMNQPSNRQSA